MLDRETGIPGREAQRGRLDALLRPRSIALVGASKKRNSVGSSMIRNVLQGGFDGEIHAVNPSYRTLYGYPCHPDLASLPGPVDLAVLAVSNRVLEQVVEEAIAHGVKALVIFASAEVEGDEGLRQRIADRARAAGIVICGANCMGFFNLDHGLHAFSALQPETMEKGGLTCIAQSGSLLQALVFNDERLRFNLAVSTGQELGATAADFMHHALDQPSTRAIALVLEAIRDPGRFIDALGRARERDIPVIVLKLGKSAAGAAFALSHTGAIAGDTAVYEALFRRHGVISVRDLDELAATAMLLTAGRRAAPGGLSAILDSGGERQLIVDRAEDLGVPLAEIGAQTRDTLAATLDYGLTPVNPVDAWGTGRDFEAVFETCLSALMRDPATGIGMFVADLCDNLDLHDAYAGVCLSVARDSDKPLALMTNFGAWSHRKLALRLARAGVAVLDGTTPSLRAVRHAMDYRDFRARGAGRGQPRPENPRAGHWRELLAGRSAPLTEDEGYALLSDYGIGTPAHRVAATREEAIAAARALGFPLVMKTAQPGILHKSDVGGVMLGLDSEDAVVRAHDALAARLGPRVLLSAMVEGQAEMAFGLLRDAQFGSFVMVAFGGIWIELLRDSQLAMAPLGIEEARDMIGRLQLAPVLDGIRGAPPCDKAALADALVRLGDLANDLGDVIAELDINPVLVGEGDIIALDCLVVPVQANSGGGPGHD
ncbi:acetate--CoA ligase family protein [Pontibaca methylaminivorans]|uniref:acetate--CoA ligase family protein n=1 Tax=Pontibaca methylaminivorans TaxID=515897 RepID=UPI002FD99248